MHLTEKTIESKIVYEGSCITVCADKAELENHTIADRDLIKHPGGVCVVAITDNNEILFVRQFRYPHKKVLLEIPAGKLNWGEDHYECGKRELKEETGYSCTQYTYIGKLFPTPAYDTEIIHMYLAKGLVKGEQNLDDDEFLEVEHIPFDEAVRMVMDNEIEDAKTQLAILKAKVLLSK